MRWLGLILIGAASFSFAGSHCPDPGLREAIIGGDTLNAILLVHKKPKAGAQVRMYASSGKTAWVDHGCVATGMTGD